MYYYEVWYGVQMLHTDSGFETREEAIEEAEMYRDSKINDYEIDGAEYELSEFTIVTDLEEEVW